MEELEPSFSLLSDTISFAQPKEIGKKSRKIERERIQFLAMRQYVVDYTNLSALLTKCYLEFFPKQFDWYI